MKRFLGVLVVSSLLYAGGALGQAKPIDPAKRAQAKEKFLTADKEYKAGRYGNALESYYESFSLSGEPLLLYNMAQCYRNLGRFEEALDTYKDFLSRAPETPFTPKAEKWIEELSAKVKPAKEPEPIPSTQPTSTSQPESTPSTQATPSPREVLPPDPAALQKDQLRLELSEEQKGLVKARRLYKIGGVWVGGGLLLGAATVATMVNTRDTQSDPDTSLEEIKEGRRRSFALALVADASFIVGGIYIQKAFSLASKERPAQIEFTSTTNGGEINFSLAW